MLLEESLFVLLMPDVLLHSGLLTPLTLMQSPEASRMEYIFGLRPTYSAVARPAHSSYNFPSSSGRPSCAAGDPGVVVEALVSGHVLVHDLRLDHKEKAVGFCVQELAMAPVLPPELVVPEVVHQVF